MLILRSDALEILKFTVGKVARRGRLLYQASQKVGKQEALIGFEL